MAVDMPDRRYGIPKSEEERRAAHYAKYGTTELPLRGTGLTMQERGKNLNYVAGTTGGALLGATIGGIPGAVLGGLIGLAIGHLTCVK